MHAPILIASGFDGVLLLFQFPVSAFFCLLGVVECARKRRLTGFAIAYFVVSAAVTLGTGLIEKFGGTTAFNPQYWGFVLLAVAPALVSAFFLIRPLLYRMALRRGPQKPPDRRS